MTLEAKFVEFGSRGLLEEVLASLDYHRFGLDRTDPVSVLAIARKPHTAEKKCD
jgi:hypothetical protein